MKEGIAGKAIYRKDYEAYPWNVIQLDLHFDIAAETTVVCASMNFEQKHHAARLCCNSAQSGAFSTGP